MTYQEFLDINKKLKENKVNGITIEELKQDKIKIKGDQKIFDMNLLLASINLHHYYVTNPSKLKTWFDREVKISEKDKNYFGFREGIRNLLAGDVGTYYWKQCEVGNNVVAIVLGRQEGFEPDENLYVNGDGMGICVKVAYQSKNSIMQCDYDIDWLMPYDEEYNEVYDTENSIDTNTNLRELYNYLLEDVNNVKKMLM